MQPHLPLAPKQPPATAKMLRTEDARKWTQAKVAAAMGVSRSCVEMWFTKKPGSNDKGVNTSVPSPDARVKVNPKHRPVMAARVAKGESVAVVAADYGISERQARTIGRFGRLWTVRTVGGFVPSDENQRSR